MKIHNAVGRVAVRARIHKTIDGASQCARRGEGWRGFERAMQDRVRAVFLRVLQCGGAVVEMPGQSCEIVWRVGGGKFVPRCDTAEHIAMHVANRVCGFGWPVAIDRKGGAA